MLGQRFNKACDSCHISKVRCVPLDHQPHAPPGPTTGTCKRCTKNGIGCVFSPVGPRRRPVRTKNDRIADLERRVKDMQLKLEKQVEKRANPPAATLASTSTCLGEPHQAAQQKQQHVEPTDTASLAPDVLERGLITPTQADHLVREFRSKLHGKYLGICLPDGSHLQDGQGGLRRTRPAFWLSVLCAAAASSLESLPLAPLLFGELKQLLDARIVPGAAPDLDALQALMNYVSFHYDPVFPLGEYILHIYRTAVAMVVGLAEASPVHSLPPDAPLAEPNLTDDHLRLSRELLRWYWASFSLSIKSRQSSMLRKTDLVDASLRVLRIAGTQHDMFLAEWIKMARIGADTALALHRGHTSQGSDGLSDEARDEILDVFEKRRKQWLVECPFDLVNEILMLEYHYHVLLISEVVYPAGVADFRQRSQGLPPISPSSQASCSSSSPPPTTTSPDANTAPSSGTNPDQNFLAPYKIYYTRKCITAAHACLDLITSPSSSSHHSHYPSPSSSSSSSSSSNSVRSSSSQDLLRRFGVVPYGRIFYALRFLLFLAHEVWKTGQYDLVDVGSLRIGGYIASLKKCLHAASAGGRYRTPVLWVYALRTRIEPWYRDLCALMEDSRSRARASTAALEAEGEVEGDRTPRPYLEPSGPSLFDASRASPPPSTVPTADTSASPRAPHEANDARAPGAGGGEFFSPLLFDFSFEILSSGGTSNPPSSQVSRSVKGASDTKRPASPQACHATTAAAPNKQPSAALPTPRTAIPPAQPPAAPVPAHQLQQDDQLHATSAIPSPTANPFFPSLNNHRLTESDLSVSFEDMDIYNNPLDFTWKDFGPIFPGSNMFPSPFPPLAIATSQPEMFGSGPGSPPLYSQGHGDDGTRER